MLARLKTNGWEPELFKVTGEEIEATVKKALDEKFGAIIAGGGDGTTTSIAAMLRKTDMPLGILPFGTLNLAARDLGVPLDPQEAVSSLHPGKTRKVDVLLVNGRPCLCMTVLGFYPWVLKRTEEFHGTNWWIKFWHTGRMSLKAFSRSPMLDLQLRCVEGQDRQIKTRFAVVIPGGMHESVGILPERKDLHNGHCSIYTSKHHSRWSMIWAALRYLLGHSASDPALDIVSSSKAKIDIARRSHTLAAIDGENIRLETPLELDLESESLRVLAPQKATD